MAACLTNKSAAASEQDRVFLYLTGLESGMFLFRHDIPFVCLAWVYYKKKGWRWD